MVPDRMFSRIFHHLRSSERTPIHVSVAYFRHCHDMIPRERPIQFGFSTKPSSDISLPTRYRHLYTNSAQDSEFFSITDLNSVKNANVIGSEHDADATMLATASSHSEEPLLPVATLIWLLDKYHDFSALPWWIIIVSSTVAMRMTLLPVLILHLKKLKRILELFPKLPSMFSPTPPQKRYADQFLYFVKQRRALGCPSFLWFAAFYPIQVSCLFLWMCSIRRMALDNHPGFDCGGSLWFQNLSDFPSGISGLIFPSLVAGLHLINIQLSLAKYPAQKHGDIMSLLIKGYKIYLHMLSVPLFLIGFFVPQGSLICWVTNSCLSFVQLLCLKNPTIRLKLGLPNIDSEKKSKSEEIREQKVALSHSSSTKHGDTFTKGLSSNQLLSLSLKLLKDGHQERAISLLKLVMEQNPDDVRALAVYGQILMQNEEFAEAVCHLESAVSKLLDADGMKTAQHTGLLILASHCAGLACIRGGKNKEGILHFERIAALDEPEDPESKALYFDSLLFLASALYNEGRRDEASKHLVKVVAFNPSYAYLLEQCESNEDLIDDLISSRRGDY